MRELARVTELARAAQGSSRVLRLSMGAGSRACTLRSWGGGLPAAGASLRERVRAGGRTSECASCACLGGESLWACVRGQRPPYAGKDPTPGQARPDTNRLETRTKESTECASAPVSEARRHGMKVAMPTSFLAVLSNGGRGDAVGHGPDVRQKDLKQSTFAGTRKRSSFSWAEGSQGKPWWTFEAVLTCKSFVRTGLRGERLIEISSSWFPPKFLSG